MLADLRGVLGDETQPNARVATEPFSQGRAPRDIPDLLIDCSVCFLTPWPHAVDQYSGPVIDVGGFISAFALNVIGRYPLGHRLPPVQTLDFVSA
jgi:hypothetical protein